MEGGTVVETEVWRDGGTGERRERGRENTREERWRNKCYDCLAYRIIADNILQVPARRQQRVRAAAMTFMMM